MSEGSGGGILAAWRRRAGATEHSADGVVGRNTAVGAHWGATAVPRRRVAPKCAPTGSGWFARRLAAAAGAGRRRRGASRPAAVAAAAPSARCPGRRTAGGRRPRELGRAHV